MLEDWERVGLWAKGEWEPPKAQPGTDYRRLTNAEDVVEALLNDAHRYLPLDTENDGPKPWSLQFSARPGNGYLISAEDKHLIEVFRDAVSWGFEGLCMHNAPHDLDVLDKSGLEAGSSMWTAMTDRLLTIWACLKG
jgi:hypothetical protein